MNSSIKPPLALFLTILMISHVAAAATSQWNGSSSLSGSSQTITDAFIVPGNSTVGAAWLNVDESGYLEDGSGITWTGEDLPGNFTDGQFTKSMVGKFEGSLSLSPSSSSSTVNSFSPRNLQLPSGWTNTGGIWGGSNPSALNGTISGQTRTLAHGSVPAAAYSGSIVAATLPGQGLPPGSDGTLVSPQYSIPNNIGGFNLLFTHWHHLDIKDGAWVEYRLDSGSWNYLSPIGGYPDSISNNSQTPNGVNSVNFTVFGSGTHSGWINSKFDLDNLTGLAGASLIQFRFRVWTDANSISRPGWYLDDISLTNQGNTSSGYWHHGCITQAPSTCTYSSSTKAALESPINLSAIGAGTILKTNLNFDLEGSSFTGNGYDVFCVELSSDNGLTWVDISSNISSTTNDCDDRTGAIPYDDYVLPNGTKVDEDSGGFVVLDFLVPSSLGANSTGKIRYVVNTDGSWNYGGSRDSVEGLSVDWFKLIDSNGNILDQNLFSTTTSATNYALSGTKNDWSFTQHGSVPLNVSEGFESSTSNIVYPSGWSSTSANATHTGWEFGRLCSSYTEGPSSFPTPDLGFGTDLCDDYEDDTDISLITPDYFIPIGSTASFVWKHWMCSEDRYDGGELFISENGGTWSKVYVNYTNGSNWYDGTTSRAGDVWDGRQYQSGSSSVYCPSTSSNIPWLDMEYDVSSYSGKNISFRFRHTSDGSSTDAGWYIDDVGISLNMFEAEGSWKSPSIAVHDLGYGFVDADIILPQSTWYGINVLDSSGQIIPGHENKSLPLSLATIDRDSHNNIHIEVVMGTEDEFYTPLIRELTVGATRYFGESNGWNLPSSISRLTNGTWVNNGGSTVVVAGDTVLSSRPISSSTLVGNFTGITASLSTSGAQSVSATSANSVLSLGDMRTSFTPSVAFSPGASLSNLVFRGALAQPAHGATIDLADDGTIDWEFSSSPGHGSYGWQNQIDSNQAKHSLDIQDTGTLSVRVPTAASVHTLLVGLNPGISASPLTISSGSNQLHQIADSSWTTSVHLISNPQLSSSGTYIDSTGRAWSKIDIQFTSTGSQFNIGSFAIGYNIMENVTGLGQQVKNYHDQTSNNGTVDFVNVPISWSAASGGVGIDGGVYHANVLTNHPFNAPLTWYPNGELQGFNTKHTHLLGNDKIEEIRLTGLDISGDSVIITLTDLDTNPTFSQTSGFEMLKLHSNSSISEIGDDLVVSWLFEVDWNWNDSAKMTWTAQAYEMVDENLIGIAPAISESGGVAATASENDLQIDSWQVVDSNGNNLSDISSPKYPFWAKSDTQITVSGTVRFEDSVDIRPQSTDFQVAISIEGSDALLTSTGVGQWQGVVTLPSNISEANLEPYLIRVGPAIGALGAEDKTLTSPVNIQVDSESPYASNLQVNSGQRLIDADGYTWDPNSPLSLQITITDNQALGDSVVMHYWREELDDLNFNGVAEESEYRNISKPLPEGIPGERTVTFSGIDVSELQNNAKFSLYFTSTDYAGYDLINGGSPGVENDMATIIIGINEPTNIPLESLQMDSHNEQLLAGQLHNLTMEVIDANGVDSIDTVVVKLLGADENKIGAMTWEPRNGAISTQNGSQITLHEVITTKAQGDSWYVSWHFSLDWDFDESLITEYALPSIVIYDDDELNPVSQISNLADIRWQLDNDLMVTLEEKSDNTPPISESSSQHIYVQPGDDLRFKGKIVYSKSGVALDNIPDQGLEVSLSTMYGSERISAYAEVSDGGVWETGLILPTRPLSMPELEVEYSITGVTLPGYDLSSLGTKITVDDKSPVVEFSTAPLSLDDQELEELQFSILIIEEGGMSPEDLIVNWAFIRDGFTIENGQSSGVVPYISNNDGKWTYSGILNFTDGVNVTLVEGDKLIWWVEVVDMAGNIATGTGLSQIDPMNTLFTVLSFDLSVTTIDITLADGSVPRGNEVVEGTEIGVVVQVRNLGTKAGKVTVTLVEDLGDSRNWRTHGKVELTIAPGQTMETERLLFETYGKGDQNLYVNLSGIDRWIANSLLPHCYFVNGNATCDLDVESDMPAVISQDDIESALDGSGLTISIMAMLLLGAAFSIVILLRREKSDESIFYEDEDWEDDENEEDEIHEDEIEEDEVAQTHEEHTNAINSSNDSEKPSLESASKLLTSTLESVEDDESSEDED